MKFKQIFITMQAVLLAVVFVSSAQAQAVALDTTFNPALVDVRSTSSIDQTFVNRIAIQPDGKILAVGYFQAAGKFSRSGIVRLNADGTVDSTFVPAQVYKDNGIFSRYGGDVYAVALQADGKILIGGYFSTVGGVARPGLARLNADGSVDTSFNIQSGGATFSGTILDIKVGADGKVTFAGQFTYNAGTARGGVVRVNADGSPDATFVTPSTFNFSTVIYRVEILSSGKTLVSGINSNTASGIGFVYRLNNDGALDSTFTSVTTNGSESGSNAVTALRLQPDGKFLGGGSFTTVNGFPLKGLARFNADGTIDTTFNVTNSGPSSFIYDIELTSSGKILVGGSFGTYNGTSRRNIALLDQNGNLDNTVAYNGEPKQVKDLAVLPDGKILVGAPTPQDSFVSALSRLNSDGTVDSTFSLVLGNSGRSNEVFVQPDGKVLVGGNFTHIDNQQRRNLSRINSDGTLDSTFNASVGGEVFNVDVRSDGKILVAGNTLYRLSATGATEIALGVGYTPDAKFLSGGGFISTANLHLRKYTETGTAVSGFDVVADQLIRRVLIQPDGKFIITGDFTTVAGQSRGRIARINADGTLDTTFAPPGGASNSIFDAVLQADGKIVVGGNFPGINFNTNYKYLARLNSDGSLDTTFNPIVEGGVQSLRVQPDGKILVGGAIYSVNGSPRGAIARVNADGTLDATFNPGAGANGSVLSIDLQSNGIVIGGSFTTFNNVDRLGVARLQSSAIARTAFDFDGDGKADISVFRPSTGAWYLQRSNSGFGAVSFGESSDVLVPADYDGDGVADLSVYRNGVWHIQRSTLGFSSFPFGASGDIPVPADYDGDGKADVAVYRPSTGTWYLQRSQLGFTGVSFGDVNDRPAVGDYDGDGKADIAVYRPSTGIWYLNRSTAGFTGVQFGTASDLIVPADYDGDGKTDIAVYRAGTWYLQRSTAGFTGIAFGDANDKPVPADYDGDGKADVSVFRPSTGTWYLQRSTAGFTGIAFGDANDKPVPNAFVR